MRAAIALAIFGLVFSGCGKKAPPVARKTPKSTEEAPPPMSPMTPGVTPVAPTPAPVAPASVPAPAPASGFKPGAHERAKAYLSMLDTEKDRIYLPMIQKRDREGLLARAHDAFVSIAIHALDDDEAQARFCLETLMAACETVGLVDADTKKPFAFKWEKFNDAGYRAGYVGTYLQNVRDTPDLLIPR